MTRPQATRPSNPKIIFPEQKAHAAKPSDNIVSVVTKIRWKALSDMVSE